MASSNKNRLTNQSTIVVMAQRYVIMRHESIETISHHVKVAGPSVYPCYIIETDVGALLIESGINLMGPRYLEAVKEYSNLELLVTHGHYDHMGAMPFLKRNLPHIKIGAHPRVSDLLQKDKVLDTMNYLSGQLVDYFKDELTEEDLNHDTRITAMAVDRQLKEGDVLDFNTFTIEVYETPGHTRDHLSFFIPEKGILFPGEALGNAIREDEDQVKPEFLSSYNNYMASMEKLIRLQPRVNLMAMSHLYYYTGDSIKTFMDNALVSTQAYRDMIVTRLSSYHGDIQQSIDSIVKSEYDEKGNVYQERNAYITNLSAQVKAIAAAL